MNAVAALIQVVVCALGGLLLTGVLAKVRARAEGRRGAPVTQPLREVVKWWSRESPRSSQASVVSRVVPNALLATALVSSALVPLVRIPSSSTYSLDLVSVAMLWIAGAVLLTLLALDAGTAFGGMGASRVLTLAALAEPALVVALAGLSVSASSSSLGVILSSELAHPARLLSPSHVLIALSLVVVLITETGRMPVDNPSTHLELTMIHEALVLETGGQDYAVVALAEASRLGFLFSVVVTLLAPWGIARGGGIIPLVGGVVALGLKLALAAGMIGALEVTSAKIRLFRVPELLAGGVVSAGLGVLVAVVSR